MAICVRCNQNVSIWAGGVNRQTKLCRRCEQEVRFQTLANIRNGLLLSKGGASTYNNVQLLCRRCNQMKGAHI